jgi:hypothetical protein
MRIHTLSSTPPGILATSTFLLLLLKIACFMVNPDGSAVWATPAQVSENFDVNHVITEFTAGEAGFRTAFDNYGYKCDLIIQSIKDGKVTGEYRRTTQVALNKKGKPEEKVLSFPRPSLTEIVVTPEDLEDLSAKYHFILETTDARNYKFTYSGKERADNRDLYVFGVEPKVNPSKERLFSGRIWVSVSDLKIVKMRGKRVQKGNQSFPVMESKRSRVGEQYLFPSHASADEVLVFSNGRSAHVRIEVRYSDYVKLR